MREAELTCKELTELITEYLEGHLPQVDRLRFEQHLAICDACVSYVDQMRDTIQALKNKPPVEIPSAIESELLKAFRDWKKSS